MRTKELRALVVGAVTWDHDLDRPDRAPAPGGVVTFAGRALARLGVRTRVVTRLAEGDHAALAPLRDAGVEVLALPSARTTVYANRYGPGDGDNHELRERSDPIGAGDVPAAWLEAADLVHAGPLHPEDVAPEALRGTPGVVGVDLQGVGRDQELGHSGVAAVVRAWCAVARVVQASHADVPALFDATSPRAIRAAYGIAELLITRGARGATLATADGIAEIGATRVAGGDSRGAGDTFLATYLVGRGLGASPVAAAEAAASVTAAAIARGEVPLGALG